MVVAPPSANTKLLIFDFDGTIADSFALIISILNTDFPEFEVDLEEARLLSSHELMRRYNISGIKLVSYIMKVRKIMKLRMAEVKPFAGLVAALTQLKDEGHKLVVASSNSAENIKIFCAQHHILPLFSAIYGVKSLFGKDVLLKKIVRNDRFAPADVIYIGDETRDIDAARKAGVVSCVVAWGYQDANVLRQAQPQFLLETTADLLRLSRSSAAVPAGESCTLQLRVDRRD